MSQKVREVNENNARICSFVDYSVSDISFVKDIDSAIYKLMTHIGRTLLVMTNANIDWWNVSTSINESSIEMIFLKSKFASRERKRTEPNTKKYSDQQNTTFLTKTDCSKINEPSLERRIFMHLTSRMRIYSIRKSHSLRERESRLHSISNLSFLLDVLCLLQSMDEIFLQ